MSASSTGESDIITKSFSRQVKIHSRQECYSRKSTGYSGSLGNHQEPLGYLLI